MEVAVYAGGVTDERDFGGWDTHDFMRSSSTRSAMYMWSAIFWSEGMNPGVRQVCFCLSRKSLCLRSRLRRLFFWVLVLVGFLGWGLGWHGGR